MKPLNCNHWFDPNIRKVIDLWSHPVWFISKKQEQCHCINDVSKQPNSDCPTCLGLGNKLRFTREYAANLNLAVSIRASNIGFAEKNIMNVYYTKNNKDIDIDIKPGDIIYDATELDQVSDVYYERSDDNDIVYWRIETAPVKSGRDKLFNNIRDALRKAGYKDERYTTRDANI